MNNRMAASNDYYTLYKNMCPMCPHVSQALSRLTFLGDTCLRTCTACVPRGIRAKCDTHEKLNTHATHVAHVASLAPPRFFARHVSEATCRACRVYGTHAARSIKITTHVRHVRDVRKALSRLAFPASHVCNATCGTCDTRATRSFVTSCEMTVARNILRLDRRVIYYVLTVFVDFSTILTNNHVIISMKMEEKPWRRN